jgi:hypothetical protein
MTMERFDVAENVVVAVGGSSLVLLGTAEEENGPAALLARIDAGDRPTEVRIGTVVSLSDGKWRVTKIQTQNVRRPFITLEREMC